MTVAGIIQQYNAERPNSIDDELKVGWLRKVEQMIISEVITQHEHDLEDTSELSLNVVGSVLYIEKAGNLTEHIASFGMDTELLVPEPYDDLYLFYLDQRIAYNNNDSRRYNAAVTQYNNALLTYQQYFNRSYKAITANKRLLRHETL